MASFGGTYDATDGQGMDSRDALPAGEYVAAVVKSEKRGPNDKGNSYINLEFEVTEGEHEGRRFWSMLNLWNSSQKAVEIAQRELNSICQACGKLRVSDSEELHGIPMRVKLRIETSAQYGDQNRVTGYRPLNEVAGGPSQSSFGSAQGGGGAPWRRSV